MIRELIDLADRLVEAGEELGGDRKRQKPDWVIVASSDGSATLSHGERDVLAPNRSRTGQISEKNPKKNLKPRLLFDEARYALGVHLSTNQQIEGLAHGSFVNLVVEAYRELEDPDLATVLEFLRRPLSENISQKVGPKDLVTFRTQTGEFIAERQDIWKFWSNHLEREVAAEFDAVCGGCGRFKTVVRIQPARIKVMSKECTITSFDDHSFWSRGKKQSTNSPLCYSCAIKVIGALGFVANDPHHSAVIARDETKGKRNPLRDQLAVFWLRTVPELAYEDSEIDLQALFAAAAQHSIDPNDDAPPAALAQLEALVNAPYTGKLSSLWTDDNAFHLAVLSVNESRLVVRDWISVSLADLRGYLADFLHATKIIGPGGANIRAFPIGAMTGALETTNPDLTRGLIRTAYLGVRPPEALLPAALLRFRNVVVTGKAWQKRSRGERQTPEREVLAVLHALAAILKMGLTYGKEDAARMEQLDEGRKTPAYLCGRLLAVIEEAQRRSSRGRVNATLVDRYYISASTTPSYTFGALMPLMETAYLPKLRRENRGYYNLRGEMEQIMSRFNPATGIPRTLLPHDQADFALGFYFQRAAFTAARQSAQPKQQDTGNGDNV